MGGCLGTKSTTRNRMEKNLEQMNSKELIREFKAAYKEKGNTDLLYQVPYLSELAHRYQEKDDWASLLRAHSLYNSCAVRDAVNRKQWLEKAYQVQVDYWRTNLQSFSQHLQVTQTLKYQLEEIRDTRRKQADEIAELFYKLDCEPNKLSSANNQQLYSQILVDIPNLSSSVNQDMITFTRSVIERALDICGQPISKYCVVALGSLARGEATPYSDLEFLFLVDNKSNDVVRCFQRFAITIYFLIGNLGETKLKYMAIPALMSYNDVKRKSEHWFSDSAMSGFKIDGLQAKAGNIPTGNGTSEQHNHFICTIQELVDRYKSVLNNPDPRRSLMGDLSAMLSSTVYISGDQTLHDDLRTLIASYTPNELREEATEAMLKNDANNFNFKPNPGLTHTRDLKEDVYRYPSLLILNLKILYHMQTCNPWGIIQLLEAREVITSQTATCLKFSLCCAQIIRLSAYFYHNSQNENISVLSSQVDENLYNGAWYLKRELLVHMFIHLMPLKQAVSKMSRVVSQTISTSMSRTVQLEAAALTSFYSGEHLFVLDMLRGAYPRSLDCADSFTQQIYILSAIKSTEYEEAEILLSKRVQSPLCDESDFYLLGRLHQAQSHFSQALEAFQTRLAILVSLSDLTDHNSIAQAYRNIGAVLVNKSKYREALSYYTHCLQIMIRKHGDRDNIDIAGVLCNIGATLCLQSKYTKAQENYEKCLHMMLNIYGNRDHVDIAVVTCNIGEVLVKQREHNKALEYFAKARRIRLRMHENRDHLDVASVMCSIGEVFIGLRHYNKALEYYYQSLEMYMRIHGDRDDIGVAVVLCNIGVALSYQIKYDEALDHYSRALEMRRRIHGDGENVDIAALLCNMGSVLGKQRVYDEALVMYRRSLEMYIRVFGNVLHPDIMVVRGNIRQLESAMNVTNMNQYRKP